MRHLAWLHAEPQSPDKEPVSRLQAMRSARKDEAYMPAVPTVRARHLLEYLFEVGPLVNGKAVSFEELKAWQDLTGATLQPWEMLALRRLSSDYMSELYAGRDPKRKSPWAEFVPDRLVTAASLRDSISRMANL